MAEFTVVFPLPDAIIEGGFDAIYTNAAGEKYQHGAVDLRYPTPAETLGKPVYACARGKSVVNRPGDGWGNGTLGNCVRIDHPDGDGTFWSIVAHLDDRIQVETGQPVERGDLLGYVGMTGLTTGPHTHWGLQRGGGGNFDTARYKDMDGVLRIGNKGLVDPLKYLAAVVAPPAAIDAVALAQAAAEEAKAAMRETMSLNAAMMLRGGIARVAYDPDLAKVEQAAGALRKAGFVI